MQLHSNLFRVHLSHILTYLIHIFHRIYDVSSAGVSGLAVIYTDAMKNGHSPARVTVGSLLFLLFDYFGLLSVIFVGLIILGFYDKLNFTDVLAYLVFLVFAIALGGLLYIASRSETR